MKKGDLRILTNESPVLPNRRHTGHAETNLHLRNSSTVLVYAINQFKIDKSKTHVTQNQYPNYGTSYHNNELLFQLLSSQLLNRFHIHLSEKQTQMATTSNGLNI